MPNQLIEDPLASCVISSDGASRQPTRSGERTRSLSVLVWRGHKCSCEFVVGTLSLGACRLVELARALVTSPNVLLADEPSSGLDTYETAEVAELLCQLRSDGLAIGLVEHDLGLVERVSDRVAVLNLGSVIAEGTYDEVMALPSVREAYLGGPS